MGEILKYPWIGQPTEAAEPDWLGPYGAGLQLVWDGSNAHTRDLASGRILTAVGTKRSSVKGLSGRGFNTTYGVGSTDKISAQLQPFAGKRSALAVFWGISLGTSGRRIYDRAANRERLTSSIIAGNPIFWGFYTASSTDIGVTFSSSSVYLNRWNALLVTAEQASPGGLIDFHAYLNGVEQTLTTATTRTGTVDTAGGSLVDIGNRADNARTWDGVLPLLCIWDKVLPASAGKELTADPLVSPFNVLSSEQKTIWLPSAISAEIEATGGAEVGGTATIYSSSAVGEIAAFGGTDAGGSATTTQEVNVAAFGGTDAGGSATITQGGITLYNSVDRGTIDLSLCSITPNGSTPLISTANRYIGDSNTSGSRMVFFHVTGVVGLTPYFDTINTEGYYAGPMLWSYTGELGGWQYFDNVSSPTAKYRSWNNSAFTQDTVYFAMDWPWRVGYTLPWIQSLESSGLISEPPSSSGNTYLFETRTATDNSATTGGDVIPAQPLYSFKIGNGDTLAPDGNAKRKMVLFGGTHASEDVGNYALKGAVDFLISADAKAKVLRAWFDTFVYPVVASAGRAGGGQRNDFQDGFKTSDVNRNWSTTNTNIETIVKHKAAVVADTGGTANILIDFHGTHLESYNNQFVDPRNSANNAVWQSAINVYWPVLPTQNISAPETYYTIGWAYSSLSADFTSIAEATYATVKSLAFYEGYGADHMRAVSDMISASVFGDVGGLQASGGTTAGGLATGNVSATVDLEASGGTEAGGFAFLAGGEPTDLSASGGSDAGGSATLTDVSNAGNITASGGGQAGGAASLSLAEVPTLSAADLALIDALIASNLTSIITSISELPTAVDNADTLLKRDMAAVTGEAARSPLNAFRFIRNKFSISGDVLTVTKEDDLTTAWTSVVQTDDTALPVIGNDPG